MKFPITRESLQAYDYVKEQEELNKEETQKRFTLILEQLCNEFKQSIRTNSIEKKFVWRQIGLLRGISMSTRISIDEVLTQFIDKLKEIFIGCDIIIDPLKTYLIIDWS
jgi:hypothetical protein